MIFEKLLPSSFPPKSPRAKFKIPKGKWFISLDRESQKTEFPGIICVGNSHSYMDITGEIMANFWGEYAAPEFPAEVYLLDKKTAQALCWEFARIGLRRFGLDSEILPPANFDTYNQIQTAFKI